MARIGHIAEELREMGIDPASLDSRSAKEKKLYDLAVKKLLP